MICAILLERNSFTYNGSCFYWRVIYVFKNFLIYWFGREKKCGWGGGEKEREIGSFIYAFIGCFLYVLYYFVFVFFKIFKLFYCCSITIVCIFSSPLYPTPVKPTTLPCFHSPFWFCPCLLYSSSWKPFSPLSLLPSPLAIVRLFLTSMSLVIFCLFFSSVDYVPVKGEIIWYLSLSAWLISLSIMLSSSIHAVAKGISSFFLSAA